MNLAIDYSKVAHVKSFDCEIYKSHKASKAANEYIEKKKSEGFVLTDIQTVGTKNYYVITLIFSKRDIDNNN